MIDISVPDLDRATSSLRRGLAIISLSKMVKSGAPSWRNSSTSAERQLWNPLNAGARVWQL